MGVARLGLVGSVLLALSCSGKSFVLSDGLDGGAADGLGGSLSATFVDRGETVEERDAGGSRETEDDAPGSTGGAGPLEPVKRLRPPSSGGSVAEDSGGTASVDPAEGGAAPKGESESAPVTGQGGTDVATGGVPEENEGGTGGEAPPAPACSETTPKCVVDWVGDWRAAGARDGVGTRATLNEVGGLTSHGGYLYFTDSHAVRRANLHTAEVETIAGGLESPGRKDGAGLEARFDEPAGIATDGSVLWVADRGNGQVRAVDLTSLKVSTLAGRADEEGRNDGSPTTALFGGMGDLTHTNRFLYLVETDNHAVRRINTNNGYVYTVAGGQGKGLSDGVGYSARFHTPRGIVSLGEGQFVVTDTKNDRPRVMNVSLEDQNHLAVSSPFGSGPGHQDGTGIDAAFLRPHGLTQAGDTVIVADTDNFTLRRVKLETRTVTTIAGAAGESMHLVGVGTEARFKKPTDVHLDTESGDLFIVDGSAIRRMIRP